MALSDRFEIAALFAHFVNHTQPLVKIHPGEITLTLVALICLGRGVVHHTDTFGSAILIGELEGNAGGIGYAMGQKGEMSGAIS